jgi:hypothetical protein
MATKTPVTEKFQNQDFDLFEAMNAIDKKDYAWFDKLTIEQQRKFVPFMMTQWISAIKGSGDVQGYYLLSVEYHANKYLFNEVVQKHPKLQWQMLCASSPGLGKQFHQWIPQITQSVSKLKSPAQYKAIKEYYGKIYPKVDDSDISEIAKQYVVEHKKKMYFAGLYPTMKIEDIELLSQTVTDEEIAQYERDRGN